MTTAFSSVQRRLRTPAARPGDVLIAGQSGVEESQSVKDADSLTGVPGSGHPPRRRRELLLWAMGHESTSCR
jgi:hypothetical protein